MGGDGARFGDSDVWSLLGDLGLVDRQDHEREREPEPGRFEAFAAAVGRELDPRSELERVLAGRVVLSAWALQAIADEEFAAIGEAPAGDPIAAVGARRGSGGRGVELAPERIFLVTHCLEKSLGLFLRLRGDAFRPGDRPAAASAADSDSTTEPATTASYPAVDSQPDAGFDTDADSGSDPDTETFFDIAFELDGDQLADLSNEWPVVPQHQGVGDITASMEVDFERGEASDKSGRGAGLDPRWQGRLVFDPNVSEESPVVKGTWVTVSQVVTLIVDGWSWSDLLRTHPELTEDDLRTCLAYTVAEDAGEL